MTGKESAARRAGRANRWVAVTASAVAPLAVGTLAIARCGGEVSTIDVGDYGAQPDDGRDDRPGVQAAIADAVARGADSVRFAPGRYEFDTHPPTAPEYLRVQGASHLTLLGDRSVLEYREPDASGLTVSESTDVRVEGFTMDYETPPFAQGDVVSTDPAARTFDVRIHDGFLNLDNPLFDNVEWGTRHDATTGALDVEHHSAVAVTLPDVAVADRTWKVQLSDDSDEIAVGDGFVIPIRVPASAVLVLNSANTSIENVAVYSAPGPAFTSIDSDRTSLRSSRVEKRPGSGRWISTSGDGFHHSGGRRGPSVVNNVFTGMLDDGVNVYGRTSEVDGAVAESPSDIDRRFSVRDGPRFAAGDEIEIFDPVHGAVRGRARVAGLETGNEGDRVLVLDRAITGVETAASGVPDQVFNVSENGAGFVISGNRFEANRGRGVVVRVENGEVVGNTFKDLPLPGVVIANDADWPEGNRPRYVSIVDNSFDNVATSTASENGEQAGAIVVAGLKAGHTFADGPLVGPVCIAGNSIERASRHAVVVGAADRVDIERTDVSLSPDAITPGPAVVTVNSTAVTVRTIHVSDAVGNPIDPGVTGGGSSPDRIDCSM